MLFGWGVMSYNNPFLNKQEEDVGILESKIFCSIIVGEK